MRGGEELIFEVGERYFFRSMEIFPKIFTKFVENTTH